MAQQFQKPANILKQIPKGFFFGSKEIPLGCFRSITSTLSISNEHHYNPLEFQELEYISQDKSIKKIPNGIFFGAKEIPPGNWRSIASILFTSNEYQFNPFEFLEFDCDSLGNNFKNIPSGIFLGSKEVPSGGWRVINDVYRTEDGDHYYEFEFHEVGNHYEIDIINTPNYGDRETDGHSRHVLPSDRGGERICFADDSDVQSISDARKYAAAWAESTSDYIKNGEKF